MYDNYVFDLYGTLVDIHTEESTPEVWEKLAMFYGYYKARYTPEELQEAYTQLVAGQEAVLKDSLKQQPHYGHEAYPEIKLEDVFAELFHRKGAEADTQLAIHAGQFFRVLSTHYVNVYEGVPELLQGLKAKGKKLYLLSNAQRIFTEYEMNVLDIAKYFDDILISSDYGIKKPDIGFFETLIQKHTLDVHKSIMIGNDVRTDIAGAKAIGMDTFYIHSNISPEYEEKPEVTYFLPKMNMKKVADFLL